MKNRMNVDKTASQIRYEESIKALARERFFKHPETLPEAIAKHYVVHAMIALQLAEIIKMRDRVSDATTADALIESLSETIKRSHVQDFGTELVDTVSMRAKAWAAYIAEIDGVE